MLYPIEHGLEQIALADATAAEDAQILNVAAVPECSVLKDEKGRLGFADSGSGCQRRFRRGQSFGQLRGCPLSPVRVDCSMWEVACCPSNRRLS